MLDHYVLKKNSLLQILAEAVDFAAKKGNSPAASLLKESADKLSRETFTLVILGEFKRGKSTFINALLGGNLLPTAVVPLTAIPTIIQHGEQLGASVIYLDGTRKAIPVSQIADYVTERGNPKNIKKLREVQIIHPSEFLKQGVILVDTPGVGSVYEHNTDAAYAYLPHSDAAIFMISIDAPLSKIEIDYLRDISKYVNKLFFVLNKIDIALPEDITEALAFTRETLWNSLGEGEYDLIPLSARQALLGRTGGGNGQLRVDAGGIEKLEEVLGNFIRNDKGRLLLESSAARALRTINELELELQLWQRAMDGSLQDLDEKITLFAAELEKLEQEREDSIYLLYREVDRLSAMVEEDINEFRTAKTGELLHLIEESYKKESSEKSAKELTHCLNDFSRNLIQSVLNEKRNEERLKVRSQFEKVSMRFFSRIEGIVDRMMSISAEIFDVPVEKSSSREYIMGSKKFFFHFEEHPTFIPSLEMLSVSGLLPKALISGHLLNNAKNKLVELFDRNCGRVRYDLADGLKEGVRDVAGELRLRADAVSQGLRTALQKARAERGLSEEERRERVKIWQRDYNELIKMKETIREINASL
ncbi:dynamin family protein [Pelotomaculum isophthalicicum JI]|uniref:Dynamin family protein n=1 Tax=Pelotomaculum isophthalicicum JI TaxID=947010 RepID=A0A9X4JW36_9FIRM|nr:dynamin family protein [Pelotomaculum isophthalicicum]MDF9409446.1 dynamin family protein [Pelotomaculum isophthalicicum JI]